MTLCVFCFLFLSILLHISLLTFLAEGEVCHLLYPPDNVFFWWRCIFIFVTTNLFDVLSRTGYIYNLEPGNRCCYNLVGLRTKLFSSQTFFAGSRQKKKDDESVPLYR